MRVYSLGVVRRDGGAVFVCEGAPPKSRVVWTLIGDGQLTPLTDVADANGVAAAKYVGVTATPIIVRATVYA